MPIINLTVDGKQVTGDNTKIVCMNKDYKVHITFTNANELVNKPYKCIVVKYGKTYKEAEIKSVSSNYQADLPLINGQTSVEIGVCGRASKDSEPEITTQAATFECVKSALCGVAVLKEDPILTEITIQEAGEYRAVDYGGADGFSKVTVTPETKVAESPTVELSMANGDQIISPSIEGRVLSQAKILKPASLVPDNIRAGVSIGGVEGNYTPTFTTEELTVIENGEYTPSTGVNGFSKVTVNVDASIPGVPIEINKEGLLIAALATATIGSIYKYTGTTSEIFEPGEFYLVEEVV